MDYRKENIKNIALVGGMGVGKTTLVEALAYACGVITKKGEVERGNTISDFSQEELNHHYSVSASLVPMVYKNTKINFIDLPGMNEFVEDLYNDLPVCSGAILVLDATKGVDVQAKSYYRHLKERNIPMLILLTKVDKENVDFDALVSDIQAKFGQGAIPLMYPEGGKNNFKGYTDVLNKKTFVGGAESDATNPDALALYDKVVEEAAGQDEELMEKFFGGEDLTSEEILKGVKTGLDTDSLTPVALVDSIHNVGVKEVLELVVSLFPSMAEAKPLPSNEDLSYDESKPFVGYVFKTTVDPFVGTVSFVLIVNGSLKVGQEIVVKGNTEKVNQSAYICGKTQTPYDVAYAGDIVCITKLASLETGLTLNDKSRNVQFNKPVAPNPTYYRAILPKTKNDEDKMSGALQKLALEDQTFEVIRNKETKQQLVGGQGSVHIDTLIEKMKNLKVEVTTEDQKIVYREAIKSKCEAEGRYVKQSGGAGYYGVVVMRFEPCEEDSFWTEEIFGGSVPKNYFPPIEKGFYEALENGPLAGFPVINVHGTLLDGKYHPVDSNELAFKNAAKEAFKNAVKNAKKVILEPIMKVNVKVSDDFIGNIYSDVSKRRGRVLGSNKEGDYTVVECEMPEAEIVNYNIDLKAMTQGDGSFSREFVRYEEVPSNVADKIIKQALAEQQ
ncbi:MAG: elongation factor G [Gammaproteobacteria bacterium]|nr:elongation factor G [Gammaproteobacteria bacterium]